jgi:hypothetical protein
MPRYASPPWRSHARSLSERRSRFAGRYWIASAVSSRYYRLGKLTRGLGLRTILSEVVVDTYVGECNPNALLERELRWLRTICAVRPIGHALSFVAFGMPVAAIGSVLAGGAVPALTMLAITAAARILLLSTVHRPGPAPSHLLILPLRDTLTFALWGRSFLTRTVRWRNKHFRATQDGTFQPVMRIMR